MKYLYPCKPNRLAPDAAYFGALDNDPHWIAEIKKNGWRCLAYREASGLVLYTRHNTLITDPLPDLRNFLTLVLPPGTIIDGELVNNRTKGTKGLYYVFDILQAQGVMLVDDCLSARRAILEKLLPPCPGTVELAQQYVTGKKRLYEASIEGEVNEGIVLKKASSKYLASETRCLQHPHWLKVKRPEAHLFTN
jgi:ATP-dependent DNA ligase